MNFFIADIGLPGWMDRIERMKKHSLDRLVRDANKVIVESRIHLDGLIPTKGLVVEKTFMQKVKAAFNGLVGSKASA